MSAINSLNSDFQKTPAGNSGIFKKYNDLLELLSKLEEEVGHWGSGYRFNLYSHPSASQHDHEKELIAFLDTERRNMRCFIKLPQEFKPTFGEELGTNVLPELKKHIDTAISDLPKATKEVLLSSLEAVKALQIESQSIYDMPEGTSSKFQKKLDRYIVYIKKFVDIMEGLAPFYELRTYNPEFYRLWEYANCYGYDHRKIRSSHWTILCHSPTEEYFSYD